MSGTDHRSTPAQDLSQPAFVLVNPQMGENIGAAARAMWNFGLSNMRIVAPRDGWPNPRAVAMASGAGRVLDSALVTPDTNAALADCTHVFATTARVRGLTKEVVTPEQAMGEARQIIADGGRVGVMFGPERAGLTNEDVALAGKIISVPVNPSFGSLNLGQCVLLTAYEWRRAGDDPVLRPSGPEDERPATAIEMDKLVEKYTDALDAAHFFWPEDKAPGMKQTLRNLFSRLPLTDRDVRVMHGMLRALLRNGSARD